MKTLRSTLSAKMPLVQGWMPAVAVAAIILSAFIKSETISILWLISLIVYGFLLNFFCKRTENDAERLNQLAEHYYFVGYIATITGLGCVLVRLGISVQSNQNLEELLTPDLLKLGGASVGCTIIGLIGMNFFRAKAFEQEQKARKLDAEQDQKRTQDVVRQIAKNFENFENRMEKLEGTRMEQFSRLMDASELSKVLNQLVGEIQGGAKDLKSLRGVSAFAVGAVKRLEEKLTGMDAALQGIAEGSGKIQQNFATIADQSDRIETLASHLESASNSLKALGEDGKSSVRELRDQFDLLGEIISQTQKETQDWKDKTNETSQEIQHFGKSFQTACQQLQASSETIIRYADSLQERLNDPNWNSKMAGNFVDDLAQRISEFVQKVSESFAEIPNLSKSLKEMSEGTARINAELEKLQKMIKEIQERNKEQRKSWLSWPWGSR